MGRYRNKWYLGRGSGPQYCGVTERAVHLIAVSKDALVAQKSFWGSAEPRLSVR